LLVCNSDKTICVCRGLESGNLKERKVEGRISLEKILEAKGAGTKPCLLSKFCVSGDEYSSSFIINSIITNIFMERGGE
jgi:hypothetical protein